MTDSQPQGASRGSTAPMHEVVQIISENSSGVPDVDKRTNRFLNGPQADMVLTDEVFSSTNTPTDILWLLHDQQNTVTDVATMSSTSGLATLKNHLEYNAFGEITSQTDATFQPRQTYTGQILDTATGLLYYDARWYDPKRGRFVSEDPIGFAAGDANLSRYVGNSWPNAVDPTGLDAGDRAYQAYEDRKSLYEKRSRDFRLHVARMKEAIEEIGKRARQMEKSGSARNQVRGIKCGYEDEPEFASSLRVEGRDFGPTVQAFLQPGPERSGGPGRAIRVMVLRAESPAIRVASTLNRRMAGPLVRNSFVMLANLARRSAWARLSERMDLQSEIGATTSSKAARTSCRAEPSLRRRLLQIQRPCSGSVC